MPDDLPLHQAVHAAVLAFNRFDLDAHPSHRERMQLDPEHARAAGALGAALRGMAAG